MSQKSPREEWQPGDKVVARYNFTGNSAEDLPFQKSDTLTIVTPTRDPNWYKAKNSGDRQGLIPANYVERPTERRAAVKLNAMPWFHGKIAREKAECLLSPREDGLFLVRESTNFPGDYTLCVCYQGKVEHYRVIFKDNRVTIDEEGFFENLTKLVEHYLKDADGLCTQLHRSVPKRGKQDFSIDYSDFEAAGWVIKKDDLQLGEPIGKGEFGDVRLATLRDHEKVAVKTLKDNTRSVQQFLAEASVMTSLRHPNLVQLIGVVFDEGVIYQVMEYMVKGSLLEYLRSRGRLHVTKLDQIKFACDTCAGMAYLESKKLVHRDLAARNVLISDSDSAKISDFGLAREERFNQEGGKFPIKWTAPEALKDSKLFSNKSDMWSFGVLLWEIYSFGRVPYPRIPLTDVVRYVGTGYRMEAPEWCPPEVYQIMREAWLKDSDARPTFGAVETRLKQLKTTFNNS